MSEAARRFRIPLYYLFTALFWGALYAYMSFFTNHAGSVGASNTFAGLIVGSYGFVQMLLRIPLGILSDRIRRRKPFVILGIAAALIAALGMLLFPTPVGLLFFRGFAGVAAAAWVTITVLFSSYFSPEDAPRAMGRLNAWNSVGNMTASLIGAQLAQHFGEPSAFWLAIALAAIGLIVSFFLVENRPQQPTPVSVGELLKVGLTPMLLIVSMLAVIMQMINMGTSGSFLQAYAKGIGASTAQLGLLTIATGGMFVLASMLGGTVLIKRFSPRAMVTAGALLIMGSVVAVPLIRSFPLLVVAEALHGIGNGLCMPMLMSLAILAIAPEKRGVAMGFYQSIYALGMFVGPVLSGVVSERLGIDGSFFLLGSLAGIMALLAAILLKQKTTVKPSIRP